MADSGKRIHRSPHDTQDATMQPESYTDGRAANRTAALSFSSPTDILEELLADLIRCEKALDEYVNLYSSRENLIAHGKWCAYVTAKAMITVLIVRYTDRLMSPLIQDQSHHSEYSD